MPWLLVAPGVSAPSPIGAILMLAAGVAWGAYSLMGQANTHALGATTGNFLRAAPIALLLALPTLTKAHPALGLIYAVLSGALASGVGYSMWYLALPQLTAAQGASVQLSVPIIAAIGGTLFLGEAPTLRLAFASIAVLGGIGLVIFSRVKKP